jgi:hypothetical protein
MPRPSRTAAALVSLTFTACTATSVAGEPVLSLQHIPVCSGYSCTDLDIVSLNDAEWQRIRAHFLPPARDAATERSQIVRAIGEFERIIGPKTGTDLDRAETHPRLFDRGQMDCIDESTNTTNYLRLLAIQGVLRWHAVGEASMRGYFFFGWPHLAATIREQASGSEYAVDSWFFENGADAVVLPLEQWRDGWSPPKK